MADSNGSGAIPGQLQPDVPTGVLRITDKLDSRISNLEQGILKFSADQGRHMDLLLEIHHNSGRNTELMKNIEQKLDAHIGASEVRSRDIETKIHGIETARAKEAGGHEVVTGLMSTYGSKIIIVGLLGILAAAWSYATKTGVEDAAAHAAEKAMQQFRNAK